MAPAAQGASPSSAAGLNLNGSERRAAFAGGGAAAPLPAPPRPAVGMAPSQRIPVEARPRWGSPSPSPARHRPRAALWQKVGAVAGALSALVLVLGVGVWWSLSSASDSESRRPSPRAESTPVSAPIPAAPTPTPQAEAESELQTLVRDLSDEDPATRARAAHQLGHLGAAAADAAPALVAALGDKDPAVASEAASALGAVRTTSALRPLTTVLEESLRLSPNPVGTAIITALGGFGARHASFLKGPFLQALEQAADPEVRARAATELGTLGERTLAQALAEASQTDPSELVRVAAVTAADKLDPSARSRLAARPWVERGVLALKEHRLVEPPDDCALASALQALRLDAEGPDARRLHEATIRAIEQEVISAARRSPEEGERILAAAAALEPGRPELVTLAAVIAKARAEQYRRTHVFRVTHRHGGTISLLGGRVAVRDRSVRGCTGLLELLEDGFRFKTEASSDGRVDNVAFRRAQTKSVELKDGGRHVRVSTTEGSFDFYGEESDMRLIQEGLLR
jgi:hypothetical protein